MEEATPEFQRLFDSATTFMVNKFITENNDADGMNLARWYSGATMKNLQKKLKLSPRTVKQSLDILACQTAQKGEAVAVREFRSKMKAELKKKAEVCLKFQTIYAIAVFTEYCNGLTTTVV